MPPKKFLEIAWRGYLKKVPYKGKLRHAYKKFLEITSNKNLRRFLLTLFCI